MQRTAQSNSPEQTLDAARLRAMFEDSVRVMLDWERLPSSSVVNVLCGRSAGDLAGWYTPWYADPAGCECSYDDPVARPVSVIEAARGVAVGFERLAAIERVRGHLLPLDAPRDVVAITYALGSGRQLVLDGNHRIQSLLRMGEDFRVVCFSIAGPVSAEILPDLRHWQALQVPPPLAAPRVGRVIRRAVPDYLQA